MNDQELVITRGFDAPRDLVWKAWTEPERVRRWWGPKGFTTPFCTIDLRVGGTYHNCMRSPEGKDYWSTGVYREIVPLEKIVCTDSFADEEGNVVPSTHYGMSADFPREMLVTATLADEDGRTKLTLRHAGLPPGKDTEDCRNGWNEMFDKLADYLTETRPRESAMQVGAYLFFEGRCDEAIEFYRRTLGAEVAMLMRFRDSPEPPGCESTGNEDKVMHAEIRIGQTTLMLSDGLCQGSPTFRGFSLSLSAADESEAERLFAGLSEGGKVEMPLARTFWSPLFGMVADRFGVSWMIGVEN